MNNRTGHKKIGFFILTPFFILGCTNAILISKSSNKSGYTNSNVVNLPFSIKGAPRYSTSKDQIHIQLASSKYTSFKYLFLIDGTEDCSNTASFSIEQNLTDELFLSQSTDQKYTLCLLGKDSSGNWDTSNITKLSWYKDTSPPNITMNTFDFNLFESDASLKMASIHVSNQKPYPIEISYSLIGQSDSASSTLSNPGKITIPENTSDYNFNFSVSNSISTNHEFQFMRFSNTNSDNSLFSKLSGLFLWIKDGTSRDSTQIIDMASDGSTTCAIDNKYGTAGRLYCWGDNTYLQLTSSVTEQYKSDPTWIDTSNTFNQVQVSLGTVCAKRSDDTLWCWGNNDSGQVTGSVVPAMMGAPSQIHYPSTFSSFIINSKAGCAIESSTNYAYCWGKNDNGAVGVNTFTTPQPAAIVYGGNTYTSIYTMDETTCAIKYSANTLHCWGKGDRGQLGDGGLANRKLPSTALASGSTFSKVTTKGGVTCAIKTDGTLWCTGDNQTKQIDNSASAYVNVFTLIGSSTFQTVSISGDSSSSNQSLCAIKTDNSLWCWGKNAMGEAGNATATQINAPTNIDSGISYTDVKLVDQSTCGLTTSNNLKCWGKNTWGQVGNLTTSNQLTPVQVNSANTPISKFIKTTGNTFSMSMNGEMSAWGSNMNSQIGLGLHKFLGNKQSLADQSQFQKLFYSDGTSTICGIDFDNQLKCWGNNAYSLTGTNSTQNYLDTASLVDDGIEYLTVSLGSTHACGITKSGYLKCWGINTYGQLGDGTTITRKFPVIIDQSSKYEFVSVNGNVSCGITTTHQLKCWGQGGTNYGTGLGTTASQNTPAIVDDPTTYKYVTVSNNSNSCAITESNNLKCWGNNNYGQLGDNTTTKKQTPNAVIGGNTYSYVSMNGNTTCAIIYSGTDTQKIQCWGLGTNGEIGNGASSNISTPTLISGTNRFIKLKVALNTVCGVTDSNHLVCWGAGSAIGIFTSLTSSPSDISASSSITFSDFDITKNTICGVGTDTNIYCWGGNAYRQAAGDQIAIFLSVPYGFGSGYKSIYTDGFTTFAIGANNKVTSWGSNLVGQTGMGTGSAYFAIPINITNWIIK